ncbi:MAG: hypothetical protein FJW96_05830 [Actinobacteria bacterium]|nr:hypothetical protein [Actinomycetota bacterium]
MSKREEAPPIDPTAVSAAYRRARATRRERIERRRRSRRAGIRFWLTLLLLIGLAVVIAVGAWFVVQPLLGL